VEQLDDCPKECNPQTSLSSAKPKSCLAVCQSFFEDLGQIQIYYFAAIYTQDHVIELLLNT
jgi:hypothetical protein